MRTCAPFGFALAAAVASTAAACASAPAQDGDGDAITATAGQTAAPPAGTDGGAAGASLAGSNAGAGANASAGASAAGGPGVSGAGAVAGASGTSAAAGAAGQQAQAGSGVAGGGGAAGSTGSCAAATSRNGAPFGCEFAWGTNDPGGALAGFAYLDFMSKWIGYEVDASGALARCDGCSWLSGQVASTDLVPVYYAYFIGYFGHANGFEDGNVDPNGPNLTTDGAVLIREHRDAIVGMYAWYAEQSARVWSDRPLVWLLEGDFVQYSGESQREPLSYAELGALTADITCAIKSAMPNAVVAVNHSSWNPDAVTNDFWHAIDDARAGYDLVWTTGVANNAGFLEAAATPDVYNHATATYAYLHGLTGRKLLVDTSFGLSAMGDTWSAADGATLDARIADGVIAANVATPPSGYEAAIGALRSGRGSTCE